MAKRNRDEIAKLIAERKAPIEENAQIRRAEKAAEEATTAANILTDCVNDNLHKANLISETILGYLPQAHQLKKEWRQNAEEKEKSIQGIKRLNWDSYWT